MTLKADWQLAVDWWPAVCKITLSAKCTSCSSLGLEKTTGMVPIDTVASLYSLNGDLLVQRALTESVCIDVLSMAFIRVAARRCNWPIAAFASIDWQFTECVGEVKMHLTGTITTQSIHKVALFNDRDDACDNCLDPCREARPIHAREDNCCQCGSAYLCRRCSVDVPQLGRICYMCLEDNLHQCVDDTLFDIYLDRANGINDEDLHRLAFTNPAVAKWRRKQILLLQEMFQEWKVATTWILVSVQLGSGSEEDSGTGEEE